MASVLFEYNINWTITTFQLSFNCLLLGLLISIVLQLFASISVQGFSNQSAKLLSFSKFSVIITFGASFMLFCYSFLASLLNFASSLLSVINYNSQFSKLSLVLDVVPDLIGFTLIFLCYFVGFISFIISDTRLMTINARYLIIFNLFTAVVYVFVCADNLIYFFLSYEALLLPSFFFVYYVSPSRRAIQAALYFVIWTQIGSFIVLLGLFYMLSIHSIYEFSACASMICSNGECLALYTLFFVGFGIKVPIWPFHYWLTKTHVEASSGFSVFLSGFLVKSALLGFYRLSCMLETELYSWVFCTIAILGVVDASLKMWGQSDIKKLVAYGTIQEMNLIYLLFCWGSTTALLIGVLFMLTHALLSTLMFFIVDCLYKRYRTRSVPELIGTFHTTPNLAIIVWFMVLAFAGLPGTMKFICEFFIFSSLLLTNPISGALLLLIANVIGLIGFTKIWYNVTFGLNVKNSKKRPMDMTLKEFLVTMLCFFFIFSTPFVSINLFQ